ncbi:MAG: lamin tail domain-containing protein [Prevotella sp.]|nr:lamin tail domain-containing protein [Prevotella sp.]
MKIKKTTLGRPLALFLALFLCAAASAARLVDYTDKVGGAWCDDAAFWAISGNHGSGLLQCDTWSSRGSRDGSDMETPFMEYWIDNGAGPLADAQIRHLPISGLPAGQYTVRMRVRCYDESGTGTPAGDIKLVANGASISVMEGADIGDYNGQQYTCGDFALECTVDEGGQLDFGIDVANATYCNWVAWKDVELYYHDTTEKPKVIATGTYYLRHHATGRYLIGGGIYGTHAVLGEHALPIEFTQLDENVFAIDCGFSNTGSTGYLAITDEGDVFTDIDFQQPWIIEKGNDGAYTLSSEWGTYLGSDVDEFYVMGVIEDGTDEAVQWDLLTKEEMLTALLTANTDNPADATFLISNARFDRNYKNSEWEGSRIDLGGLEENWCAEAWNRNYDIYQILENIPNGRYRLTVQGFYRWNNNGQNTNWTARQAYENGTEQLYAMLYAGDQSTPLQSIASELEQIQLWGLPGGDADLPYSMTEASWAFSYGLYAKNRVEVDVTNHELKIGLRKEQQDGVDWTIWDNFELTLLQAGNNADYNPSGKDDDDELDYDKATWDNPLDVTSLITNANFNSQRGWKGYPGIGGNSENPCAEAYNKTFDVYQTLNDVPDGWYRLRAQGFYRYGSYEYEQHKSYYGGGWEENDANNVYAMYTIPYAIISHQLGIERGLAHLYANHVEQELPSPFSSAHEEYTHADDMETEFGWVVNSQWGASEAFTAGEFPVELMVPVVGGQLRLGVKKGLGYKYDWSVWDNFQLEYLGKDRFEYVAELNAEQTSITMARGEERQLTVEVLPANASNCQLQWTSSNPGVVSIDSKGVATAKGDGQATITVRALGSQGQMVTTTINVQVSTASVTAARLVINEIQVSNLDMFLDRSLNYGGYVELYNPTSRGISLDGLYVSDDASDLTKHRLTSYSGAVPAKGFGIIWFDHATSNNGQVDFKLNMDGGTIYISDSSGKLLASQSYPPAVSRTSYALTTDGGNEWGVTAHPTPGASNAGSGTFLSPDNFERLPMPELSHESQVFTTPFTLTANVPAGATLRYSTDGTTPTDSNGQLYTDGINIAGTTVVRMRLFQDGLLPSAVKTCSYILRDKDYMLPVLSVVANPDHLYSDSIGVFVTGENGVNGSGIDFPCNWNMDWDRLAAFNYITASGDSVHSQEVALTRFGGWSRSWYPYNFKLKAQSLYEGQSYLTFPFFPNKPYQRNKVLQVRNGGNDLLCRIKDAALHNIIISSGLHLDCQDYMPVHTFINGRYIGMLNIREPSNKHMGYSNYGLDTDEMDQMRLGGGVEVNVGSAEAFTRWRELSRQAANENVYQQICDMVDIDEFVNYMATQMFLGGDDWPGNNCKAFKGWDSKFHIVLFDIDQALRYDTYAFQHIMNNRNVPLVSIFLNMLNNDRFRRQFVDTYSIVAGSVFDPDRCAAIIDRISAEMDPALAFENLSTQPTADYMKQVLTAQRRDKMMEGLRNWSRAQINTPAQRVVLNSNIGAAQLQANGLVIPMARFNGTLFAPCTLTASAPEGYVFKGWQEADGTMLATTPNLTIDHRGDLTLTAVFERMDSDADLLQQLAMPVKVNEVSAGNDIYANEYFKRNDWLELYNNTDQPIDVAGLYVSDDLDEPLKFQIPQSSLLNTVIPAGSHLILWADKLESQSQIHANFKLGNDDGQMVVVSSSDAFVANNSSYFSQHPSMHAFVDGMTYNAHRGDESVGRFPDGGADFYLMTRPTIERTNRVLTTDQLIGHDQNLMKTQTASFQLQLAKGWNWTSHILQAPIAVDDLSSHAERIVGQQHEAIREERLGMTGTLRQLVAGNLYKVQMSQTDTFDSDAPQCTGQQPLTLQTGWNWIGYPCNGMQTLTAALAGSPVEEGDQLIGQDGFATYGKNGWTGTLSAFETGKGYLYKSASVKSLRFNAPSVAVNMSRQLAPSALAQRYGVDKHAHPNVMGLIAQLQTEDGQPLDADRFTLLAYSADECRGFSKTADGLLWLTTYGQGGEDIVYRAVDRLDDTVYALNVTTNDNSNNAQPTFNVQRSTFNVFTPGINGTVEQPVVLSLAGEVLVEPTNIGEIALNAKGSATAVGYYSLSGVFLGCHAAKLPAGIYMVKYDNGNYRKLKIEN